MKKILLLTLCISLTYNAVAQTINLEIPLPEEKNITKGVLENGLTYYLHNTSVT